MNPSNFSSVGISLEELLEQSYYHFLYKGKDKASGQPVLVHHWPTVLIKTLGEQRQFSQDIARFQQLAHPHILPIFTVRIHERGASLISPYPPQGSLQARLNRQPFQPLPLHEAYTIIKQVGQALHHAHQHQIFHGSLTPWAVFFHNANHVVVTSFHFPSIIAALPNYQPIQNQRLPHTWYMAPEQFDGVMNEKTDQYALGCLAYALLTGRVPLPGYTHRTLIRKHHSEAPKAPIAYNSQIPVHVEEALLKAMAKQPEQRYASIQDFLNALEAPTRFAPQVRVQPLATATSGYLHTTVAQGFHSLPPVQTFSRRLSAGFYSRNPFHTLFAKGYQGNSVLKRPLLIGLIALVVVIVLAVVTVSAAFAGSAHKAPSTGSSIPGRIAHHAPTPTLPPSTPAPTPTPVPPTSTPTPPRLSVVNSCRVDYEVTGQMTLMNGSSGGFSANITITNTSSSTIHGWQLVFSYAQGQQIVSSVNAYSGQQGQQMSLSNMSSDATIAPGQSLTATVVGTWTGSDPVPTTFILNNTRCQ